MTLDHTSTLNLDPFTKKVARCTEQPESLPHCCSFNCADVSKLLKEIGRLQAERLVLPMDTCRNDDGSIVVDGRRYTPDAEIMVHQG